jgi:alcohol dehydrogenase (cytochrome c)
MIRIHYLAVFGILGAIASVAVTFAANVVAAQEENFTPVTQQMLENPSPNDWLMFSRTYDAQRFSPLDQINKENVDQLRLVWARGLPEGTQESIPLIYEGVLYSVLPGAGVLALNATNGDQLWATWGTLPSRPVPHEPRTSQYLRT